MEKGGDGGDKVPRIVQVMYFKDLPRPAMPPNSSQPPGMAMPQQWETQWQEFLKTLQPPPLGWGNPQATTESVPWEDAKAFLSSFEEVAEACQWPRDQWVGRLLPALRGGVKQCLWRLNARDKRDYGKVKAAILRDDAIRTESKRQHFRQCDFQEGPRTVYGQLQELCRQWLKPDRRSKEQILELIIQEQLLAMLPQEVQHKVKECGPEDCIATVALAESFLMSCQTAKTWEKQAPLPEGTVGSLETEGVLPNMARRQFGVDISRKGDGEIGLMANEATSTQSSDVVLPPEGQEMAGAGLAEEPVDVKNVALDKAGWTDQDLDQKPPLPWSVMQQISGNASASDGLSIPTPDISQPGPQETACTQRPENEADIPDSLLGGRLPSEIKTENSQESDAETEYSTLEPFPEDYQDNVSGSPEPSTQRELRPRKPQEQQQQGRATRGRKKRGNGIRKNKYYPKEKKHECPVCGHRAYFLSDLLRHMRCHSGKRPFRCLECGTTFSKKESFHTHQRRFHKSTAGGSSSSKKKMFDRSQEEVAASHQGTNKYVCPTCGFKATALKHLTEHMTIHTGERLYECPECGKMFRWMSNLSRHRRLHLLRNNLERRRPAGAEGSGKLQNHSVRHYRLRLENVLGTSSGIVADVCEPSVTSRLRPRKPLGQGASLYNEEAMALQEGLEWEDFFGPASLSSESVESRPTSRFRSKPPEKGQGDSRRLGRAAVAVKRSINYGRQKKHACQQCDYKSKRLSDVVKHMRVHTRERPYKCLECGISYRWLSNYTEHKKICTTSKRTPVPEAPVAECDVTLSDDEELINILQKSSQQRGAGSKTSPKIVSRTPKTNGVGTTSKRRVQRQSNAATVKNKGKERKQERKHECSVCGHRAVYWSDLIRHLRIHTREKPYQCQQCGKAFAQKSSLTGHKKIHTSDGAPSSRENHVKKNTSSLGEKNYTCSKCGHRASKLVALLKHMRVHLGERPYQCQDCGETFAWHSLLSRHQRTHMLGRAPNDTKAPVAGPQETSVGNEEPSKMLEENSPQERTELKEARTPSPEGAHGDVSLQVADGSSKEEKATPLKKQTESNEGTENSTAGNELVKRLNLEMFAYSKGEKSCQSQSGLVTDQIIHEKEKPQESSVCEKSHSIKCSLMKYQHGKPDVLPDEEADVKPYVCHDCGKCFSLEERLSRHQLMHTGLRPYSCAECGNAYNRRDALLSHLKSHGLSTTRDAPSTATASVEGSAKEEISVKLERTDEWEAYKQGSVGVGTEAAKTPADTYRKSHGLSTTRDAPSTATASVEGSAKEEISVKLERTDEWEAYKQGSVGVGTEAAKTPADTYKKE